jgi:hypothetical protein
MLPNWHRKFIAIRQTLLTICACWILSFSNFSIPFCTIFLRSFIPPLNAASGSSNSLFICPAIFWWAFPIDSTSPLITSSEARRVPASWEPSDLRLNARSFREYSSSIVARAFVLQSAIFADIHKIHGVNFYAYQYRTS